MELLKLSLLLLIGITVVYGATISRGEIEELKRRLDNSVSGKYHDPETPELGALQDPWERSGKFEGDILLTQKQIDNIVGEVSGDRNALIDPTTHWPNKTVLYAIREKDFNADQIKAIEDGMRDIENNSCVIFKKRVDETNFVNITGVDNGGCVSWVGLKGGAQELNYDPDPVGEGCLTHGTIVHELLHALGFYHLQSTHNRDEYVKILWENIKEEEKHNFNKYSASQVTNYDVDYDYESVLHYHQRSFTRNGKNTILVLKPTARIGQRDGLSPGDIRKLNLLYECIPKVEEKTETETSDKHKS